MPEQRPGHARHLVGQRHRRDLGRSAGDEIGKPWQARRAAPLGMADDIEAAMRADELMDAGDMEGEAVWLRIVKAVEELGAREKPRGATTH